MSAPMFRREGVKKTHRPRGLFAMISSLGEGFTQVTKRFHAGKPCLKKNWMWTRVRSGLTNPI